MNKSSSRQTTASSDGQKIQDPYETALNNPDVFWGEQGRRLDWIKPYTKVKNTRFAPDVSIKWYEDGVLNVSANCLDRHLTKRGDKPALIWVPDDPDQPHQNISYTELHRLTCKFANVLKDQGVKQGDRVIIYMPMIPVAAAAMLACARIGAIHSVVFAGFSAHSLQDRITDCDAHIVLTTDEGRRGGKVIGLKKIVDEALEQCPDVRTVLVARHTGADIALQPGRDLVLDDLLEKASSDCVPAPVGAEDPLFILYTSGSTGKPKGVLHTSGGYLVYAALTHEKIFDIQEDDIYWCTADIGWVTGHSYLVYGPLANGCTSVMFEGVPNWPDASRVWKIVDTLQVTKFYTAPTAIRGLMQAGDQYLDTTSRVSLKILGSVGEPINPEAWLWYHEKVGLGQATVVDTWWQTETGGHMITPLPHDGSFKPGSATKPFYGIKAVLVDNEGKLLEGEAEGNLCIADSWPGQMRTVYGDHARFEQTYFSTYPGYYFTGDGARRDGEGDYWITGRVDDVINVAGHRFGTAEIESALIVHPAVAESAVVGMPHDLKGQGIYAFVCLKAGEKATEELKKELVQVVRKEIGPIATPDIIQFTPGLPKTRSGKIMRRILRKLTAGEADGIGDISTLADPSIVAVLKAGLITQ